MAPRAEIIALITSYFPAIGGAEVALRQVAERLSAEFDFLIVTSRGRPTLPKAEFAREGLIWRLGFGSTMDRWLLPITSEAVHRRIRQRRGEGSRMILWGMDVSQASLTASFLHRRNPDIPFVLTIQYGEAPGRLAHGRMGLIRRSFEHMLGQADQVTAVSNPLAELARTHGHRGPISVIPNGVDIDRFRRDPAHGSTGGPTVVTVSRLVRKNGVDCLLQAIARLKQDVPGIVCRIIGDGPERSSLMRLSSDLGISSSVLFLGKVLHEEIPRHLWESDIFVRPARSEGMGTAFVEAMASGLPVIGTAVGGVPDVIHDGETGLLAEVDHPDDLARKIRRVLADKELAARLARQGMAMVLERFDAEFVSRRYAHVFREALRG